MAENGWRWAVATALVALLAAAPVHPAEAGSFRSPGAVILVDGVPAVPYPSQIEVSGLTGTLTGVVVGFADVEHVSPRDADALLVSPAGTAVLLMSDACGLVDMVNIDLAFEDAAPTPLPAAGPCAAGSFQPSDYAPADDFPAPAPAGPWGAMLSDFLGTDPNGTWSLYALDDLAVGDSGRIEWWYLAFTTGDGPLLVDGFELGSTARWSAAVP